MEERLIHGWAVRYANWVNKYVHNEGNDYLKIVYLTEIMIINITKLIIIFAITVAFGTFVQTVALLLGFNLIRRYAFGLHAKKGIGCTIGSILLFIAVPYFLKGSGIDNWIVFPAFCAILLTVFIYAPADTEHRPLVGKKKRARFKKRALAFALLVMVCTLFITDGNIKAMVTLGAVYEAVSLLPMTYKILKRRYKNYEEYEGNERNVGAVGC